LNVFVQRYILKVYTPNLFLDCPSGITPNVRRIDPGGLTKHNLS